MESTRKTFPVLYDRKSQEFLPEITESTALQKVSGSKGALYLILSV